MNSNNSSASKLPLDRQSDWLKSYRLGTRLLEQGSVASVGDGITWIKGLPSAAMDDVLEFEDGSKAVVFSLSEKHI
ncbi:MAG: F0F1 ATP synthase subunit alpha, partial [Gammaproteobacteria bacterium]|nr:F0F1 ATP synthase subunit alpha [Gammaproteobacteria bacterium]